MKAMLIIVLVLYVGIEILSLVNHIQYAKNQYKKGYSDGMQSRINYEKGQ